MHQSTNKPNLPDNIYFNYSIIGEKRNAYRVLWENQKARDHLKDLDVDGRINVVRILKE